MIYLTGRKKAYKFITVWLCLFMLLIMIFAKNAFAFKVNYGGGLSYETTSNPLHIPEMFDDGSYNDEIVISSFFLKFNEDSSTLKSTVDLKVNYLDYVDDLVSDQTMTNLKSSFLWKITPGYYSWYLMDNIVQSQKDVSLLVSEANSQDVNEFLSGPRLEWKVGGSTLKFNSYVNTFTYSETDNDSTNLITTLLWGKVMPSGVDLDLKYTTKFVTFDNNDQLSPYDLSTVGASVKYIKKTNSIDFFFGRTYLNSDDVSDSVFVNERIAFKRNLTRNSSLGFVYSNGLTNKDESLSSGDTVLTGIFVNKETSLTYQRSNNVFGLNLKAKRSEKNNIENGYSDYIESSEIGLFRILGERSKINITYSETFNSAKAGLIDFEDNMFINKITYQKRFNNNFSFSLYLTDLKVESDQFVRQFTDKKIGLTISIVR